MIAVVDEDTGASASPSRRRRRRRATAPQGPPPEAAAAVPVPASPPPQKLAADTPAPQRRKRASRDPSDRALGDLVGAGHTQLSQSAALRARDVNRPTEQDLAEAERDVVIVRRNWRPS